MQVFFKNKIKPRLQLNKDKAIIYHVEKPFNIVFFFSNLSFKKNVFREKLGSCCSSMQSACFCQ